MWVEVLMCTDGSCYRLPAGVALGRDQGLPPLPEHGDAVSRSHVRFDVTADHTSVTVTALGRHPLELPERVRLERGCTSLPLHVGACVALLVGQEGSRFVVRALGGPSSSSSLLLSRRDTNGSVRECCVPFDSLCGRGNIDGLTAGLIGVADFVFGLPSTAPTLRVVGGKAAALVTRPHNGHSVRITARDAPVALEPGDNVTFCADLRVPGNPVYVVQPPLEALLVPSVEDAAGAEPMAKRGRAKEVADLEDAGGNTRFKVTATHVARRFHLSCDRFLWRSCHIADQPPGGPVGALGESSAFHDAMMEKGDQFERSLRVWLQESAQHPLKQYHNQFLGTNALVLQSLLDFGLSQPENTVAFAWGVRFEPGLNGFAEELCGGPGRRPGFVVGGAIVDFVELRRQGSRVVMTLLDAKASRHVHTYHVVQVTYYWMAVSFLLSKLGATLTGGTLELAELGGVWLPGGNGSGGGCVRHFVVGLVQPSLRRFLHDELPVILDPASRMEDQAWRLCASCSGCPFRGDCREQVERERLVSAIPYLSASKHALITTHVTRHYDAFRGADAERWLRDPVLRPTLRQVLMSSSLAATPSPVIEALVRCAPTRLNRRSHLVPAPSVNGTHVQVGLALLFDTEGNVLRFALEPTRLSGASIDELCDALQRVVASVPRGGTVQFFCFDSHEYTSLLDLALAQAQGGGARAHIWRSLLAQLVVDSKLLLLGASRDLLNNIGGVSTVTQDNLERSIASLGGEVNPHMSRQQMRTELDRLISERRMRFLRSPGICEVHALVRSLLATPEVAFFDFEAALSFLLPNEPRDTSLARDVLYQLHHDGCASLPLRMAQRAAVLLRMVDAAMTLGGRPYLCGYLPPVEPQPPAVPPTKDLVAKLLFLREFEAISTLSALRDERSLQSGHSVDLTLLGGGGAGDEVYRFTIDAGIEHLDSLALPPSPDDEPEGKGKARAKDMYFDWIVYGTSDALTEDQRFCDSLWYNTPAFPVASTRLQDACQMHSTKLYIANVEELDVHTRVLELRLAGAAKTPLRAVPGTQFALRMRFVDFNLAKTVTQLGMLMQAPYASLFEQLVLDPVMHGARQAYPVFADPVRAQTGAAFDVHADVGLALSQSQRDALNRCSTHCLTLLWGPPGTGKTHCLAVLVLQLLDQAHRAGVERFHVLMTAFTSTAIATFLEKFHALFDHCKRRQLTGGWDKGLEVFSLAHQSKISQRVAAARFALLTGSVWAVSKTCVKHHGGVYPFELLIIDEASQLQVADASIPFHCVRSSGRIVVCGDHLQLKPMFRVDYPEPPSNDQPLLATGILQCLLRDASNRRFDFLLNAEVLKAPNVCALREQRRMCRQLATLTASLYGFEFLPLASAPVRFRVPLSTERLEHRVISLCAQSAMVSLLLKPQHADYLSYEAELRQEAGVVCAIIAAIMAHSDRPSVFVATPHRAQRSATLQAMHSSALSPAEKALVCVDTVDRMQGKEADVVLISYGFLGLERVECEMDFIFNLNRLNVAVSRSRSTCILLCSELVLRPPLSVVTTSHRQAAFGHLRRFFEESVTLDWPLGHADNVAAPTPPHVGSPSLTPAPEGGPSWSAMLDDLK